MSSDCSIGKEFQSRIGKAAATFSRPSVAENGAIRNLQCTRKAISVGVTC